MLNSLTFFTVTDCWNLFCPRLLVFQAHIECAEHSVLGSPCDTINTSILHFFRCDYRIYYDLSFILILYAEQVYGLPTDRIYATYFGGDEKAGLVADDEARNIWLKFLPPGRVLPFGCKVCDHSIG